jgi:beta-lactamase regulating signal transducer with metallopeptidase domain
MIASLLDHLWQSTLFAGGIALLTLFFRRNGAAVRFWLWFAASVKFLLPFAGLVALGEYLSRQFPAALPSSLLAIQPAAEKLSAPAKLLVAPHAGADPVPLLVGVWVLGLAAIAMLRLLRWLGLRAVMANAQDVSLPASMPVRVKTSSSLLEPGLVGIVEPVVLLPQGLMARLSEQEQASILAHELSHLSRRDNVTAAIHMTVEALFWFYPPVWLIGARLIAERERACDENVVASGHDPEVYAGGILKVCKFCIQSPLACASGASGADLKQRVRQIMSAEAAAEVHAIQRLLLAGTAVLALALPVMAGFQNTPLTVTVKQVIAARATAERAVTAVAEEIGIAPVQHVMVKELPRLKVKVAAVLPPLPMTEPEASQAMVPATSVPLPAPATPTVVVSATAEPVAPALPPAAKEAALALNPTGTGDPDSITCRVPQLLPGSRLAGPAICKTNRVWAELHARRQDISPDGKMIVYLDDFQRRQANLPNCRDTFFSRAGVTSLSGPSTTFCF